MEYSYDSLNRVTQETLNVDNVAGYYTSYSYVSGAVESTSPVW